MRWLGLLAILIVGAGIYLRSILSDGATPPKRDQPARQQEDKQVEVPVDAGAVAQSDPKPIAKAEPIKPTPAPTRPIDRPADPANAPQLATPPDAKEKEEEPEWTEQERWQKLWAANGRFEKGNYPGAVELSLEIARRYPPWQEDAWKVTIRGYCAMNEPAKANALFDKMTDAGAIEEITKFCTEWNVKLQKSK